MLEAFSDRARAVVAVATDEARRLDHGRVGTEHLLLGLLADRDGGAAALLREAGATLEAARPMVAEVVGSDGEVHGDDLPYTARARRALERAARFSRHERAPRVGTDHVLLGVLDVEGLACQVLRGLGVDVTHLRDAVDAARTGPVPAAAAGPVPEEAATPPRCASCGATLETTLSARLLHAQPETGTAKSVLVLYCASCGTALGAVPP